MNGLGKLINWEYIEEELIKFAHEFAKKTKQSLSSLISHYLIALKEENNSGLLCTKTNNLYGIFSGIKNVDKKELRKQFHEKDSH